MRAEIIARALGRAQRIPSGGYLASCPVPSHGQGRGDHNPSLSIKDGDKGLLVRCFSGCDSRDVLGALRARGLLDDCRNRPQAKPPKPAADEKAERDRQCRKAAGLWAHRRPIIGSIAESYLRAARGITIPIPFATLGFLPPRNSNQHPAMIACFARHDEPEPGALGLRAAWSTLSI